MTLIFHWFFFVFQERRRNSSANETCYRIAAADQRHLFVVFFVRFQKSFKSWRIDSRRRRKSISTFFYHRGRAFEVILTTSNQLTHLCSLVDNAFELENIYLSLFGNFFSSCWYFSKLRKCQKLDQEKTWKEWDSQEIQDPKIFKRPFTKLSKSRFESNFDFINGQNFNFCHFQLKITDLAKFGGTNSD